MNSPHTANTLSTARLELCPPTRSDTPAITAACQDPDIQAWTTIPSPYSLEHAEGFLEIVEAGWASGLSPTWAIRRDSVLIGTIGLVDEGAGGAEVGFWLIREERGQGLMGEAVAAVCRYGFDHMGLIRISWRARVGNTGSMRVARRAGFRYEGLARLGLIQRGQRYDAWIGSLLADDDGAAGSWPNL